MSINRNNYNEVECELMMSGYNSLEIAKIWRDKKLLNKIFDEEQKVKDELEGLSHEEQLKYLRQKIAKGKQ